MDNTFQLCLVKWIYGLSDLVFMKTAFHKIDKWLIQIPVRSPWMENNTNYYK